MPIDAVDFNYIRNLVREQSAIVLDDHKEYLVEARLAPLVRRQGCASISELLRGLRDRPPNELHRQVVEAMTTNETSFFRDRIPFEALKHDILPELMEKRAGTRALNIWCSACSNGQEPYSIAMLLQEHFPVLGTWDVHLLATDLSIEVLEKAKQGRYSKIEVNRGLPITLLIKYFENEGLEWRIRQMIRQRVAFRPLNLIESWPHLPAMDIVFLRNVLIYFDVPTKRTILRKIRQVLRPDGYLFLGTAETTMNLDEAYERVVIEKAACYQLRS